MTRCQSLCLGLLLLGCGGEGHSVASRNRSAASSVPVPGEHAAFILRDGPNDCGADTIPVHNDPVALVRAFVDYDTSGKRLDDNDHWGAGAVTCIERLGSDVFGVVTRYSLEPLTVTNDSARVLV